MASPRLSAGQRRRLLAVGYHAGLVALALMFLAPLAFITLTSLMSDRQALSGRLWPEPRP